MAFKSHCRHLCIQLGPSDGVNVLIMKEMINHTCCGRSGVHRLVILLMVCTSLGTNLLGFLH